jgi:2-keto-4-pentenoate hydratase/2-oxohepta-3-ene-1,7-dioic acid hydratase in catechol pathway
LKLLRYGAVGEEQPGMLDSRGRIRSLFPMVTDLTPALIGPEGLALLAAVDPERLPLVEGSPRLGVPIAGAREFYAVGLNYRAHAEEASMAIPVEPIVFNKALSSLAGATDDVLIPEGCVSVDWEIELGFVIGSEAYQVKEAEALDYVAGYFTAIDFSERDFQTKRGGQFIKGKSLPSFGPIGPYLVTRDEIPDPQSLDLRLDVNGKTYQKSNTADMLFSVSWIIAHLSTFFKLMPGDLVITGTPAGVGLGRKPTIYLKSGDVVTGEVSGLGKQVKNVR